MVFAVFFGNPIANMLCVLQDFGPSRHDHEAAGTRDRVQDHGQGQGIHEGQEKGDSLALANPLNFEMAKLSQRYE